MQKSDCEFCGSNKTRCLKKQVAIHCQIAGVRKFEKYRDQRDNAKQRHIPFLLNFEQWWGIWEASGHWYERGRKAQQYVMARIGDKGPYAIGNVKIITWIQNVQERNITDAQRKRSSELAKNLVFTDEMRTKISKARRGEGNHYAKLTEEQVRQIRKEYKPKSAPSLAKKFNVSRPTISNVITRKTWKYVK